MELVGALIVNKSDFYLLCLHNLREVLLAGNDSAPVIKTAVETLAPADATIIYVDAGDRPFWKDPQNPFRHDASLGKIQVIPTFIRYRKPQRLEGSEQCAKLELLEMFFETEDD